MDRAVLARVGVCCTLALALVLGERLPSDAQSIGSKTQPKLGSATLSGSTNAGNISAVTAAQQPAPTAAPSGAAAQPISRLASTSSLPREAVLAPTAAPAPTGAPAAPRTQAQLGSTVGQVVSLSPTQAPAAVSMVTAPSRAQAELSTNSSVSSPPQTGSDAPEKLKTEPAVSLVPASAAAGSGGHATLREPTPQAAVSGPLNPAVLASVVPGTTLQSHDSPARTLPAAGAATEHAGPSLTSQAQAQAQAPTSMPSVSPAPKIITPVESGEALKVAAPLAVGGEVGVAVGAKAIQTLQEAQPEIASARVVVDPAPPIVHTVPDVVFGNGRITLAQDLAPVDVLLDLKDTAGNVVRPVGPAVPDASTLRSLAYGLAKAGAEEAHAEHAEHAEAMEAVTEVTGRLDDTVILVQLPLGQPSAPGEEFHWLYEVLEDGVFLGYTWSPDEIVDHEKGIVTIPMLASQLQGTLFLPASISPGYVANHDPLAQMWSGPTQGARGFGFAGPQFTTFTVLAPQVGLRLFVYSPVVNNYAWIDALGVGPVGPPTE